ncbi:SurA N-terminal domain-containing protein [Blattabacterium cuenoti]|uniref:SurA N-terminal domain-containing protein n=1 Tax=Blattabacterium cuenoti TaxID=1653831 RepID=UPI00163BDA78|nr:SurA N-terminal domain-containing protein [Blattabacterium cuenoti]
MSFLEKIRKNTWILFFFIGISMLSFILDPHILLKFFTEKSNIIGKVNGENISVKEYTNCFQFLKQFRKGESDYDIKKDTWNLLIHEKLLNEQAIKVGIQSNKEDFLNTLSKQSIYSYIPEFQDKYGFLDIKKFQLYLNRLESPSNYYNPQLEVEKKIWFYEKENIPKRIVSKKYIEMLMYGLNTSSVEAELNFKGKELFSIVDYVFIPYSEIERKYNLFTIENKKIKNFVQKHKFIYKKENLRSLSFIIFKSIPSLDDEIKMKKKMEELFHKLKLTNQNLVFVSNQSEKDFDSNFYLKKDLPIMLQNFIKKDKKIGSMFGPFKNGNQYMIAKLIGKEMISNYVLSSHILISHEDAIRSSNNRNKKEAKKIANEIYNDLKKNPYKFDFFLKKKSDDFLNTKKNKGSLGWLRYEDQNNIGKYNIFHSKNKIGMIGLTETKFGYHILRIDNKSKPEPAYQFALIVKTLFPSKNTEDLLYNEVKFFLKKNKNYSLNIFLNNARKKGYDTILLKDVKSTQWDINEFNTEVDKEILNWSFEKKRKEGDTHIFSNHNKNYIIAYLSKIKKKGYLMEEIKNNLIPFLRKERIKNILSNTVKKNIELEEVSSIFSKRIKKGYKINFHDSIINGFKEPKVVGFSLSLKKNKTSKPIFGEKGIFFIRPIKHISSYKKPSYFSHEIEISNTYLRKKILENLGKVLIKKSKIKDYRKDF